MGIKEGPWSSSRRRGGARGTGRRAAAGRSQGSGAYTGNPELCHLSLGGSSFAFEFEPGLAMGFEDEAAKYRGRNKPEHTLFCPCAPRTKSLLVVSAGINNAEVFTPLEHFLCFPPGVTLVIIPRENVAPKLWA